MKRVWYSLLLLLPLLFVGCADAGKDQVVKSATNVVLDGSASTTEVNGEIKKYKWKQISGKKVKLQNKKEIKASFIAPTVLEDTKLVFRLITIEKGGYISPFKSDDTVEILVQPQTSNNNPPIAAIQTSDTEIKLNQSINFDASTSTDSDGTIVTYEWTNTDGDIISSDKIFDYTFTSVGNHTVTLNITDDGGLSSSTSVEIVVNDLIKPLAKIIVSAETINIGESVTFDASTSSDQDGEIVTYTWKDETSNTLSFEKIYTHTFNTQGQYPITLIVEDNDGLTHSEEIIITVQALLTSIELAPEDISLEIGNTQTISSTGNYNDGTSLDITANTPWIISDDAIISIDNTGTITALKSGTTTVKTTIEDVESNIVTVNVIEPLTLQSIKITPNPITLRINKDTQISIKGVYSDGTIKDIEDNITYEIADTNIVSFNGLNTLSGLATGETTLKVTVGNINSTLIPIKVNTEIVTTNFDFTHFGTQYVDQIPENATIEKYDEKLFNMLTGKILDEDLNPMSGVKVSIHNHPQYGSVLTKDDGSYVIPSEGGRYLTVRYERTGYTTIDRKVYADVEDWSIAPDVTMLKIDDKVTTINLNNQTPQIHNSTIITDDRGSRATTLVFNNVTSATVKSPDGSTRILDTLDVRATEFVTPESMPSDLPIESAYTYCSDLTVDGVKDDETVEFNAPVIMYVDNFLGFDVGEIVPIGYYDRNKGEWIGSKNGAVVQLLDTNSDGKVDGLDATGDGVADDLDEDGNTTSEVKGIEDNPAYQVGMTYWRAEITHFTPWDHNWPYGPPKDAEVPKIPETITDNDNINDNNDCNKKPIQYISSYVETKTKIFHDDISIAGSNLTLHYTTKRVNGYNYIIDLTNSFQPPSSVTGVDISLKIAGRIFEKSFTPDELSSNVTFIWDGKDLLGNHVSGEIYANIEVSYKYKVRYFSANSSLQQAWAELGSSTTGIRGRSEISINSKSRFTINSQVKIDKENAISNGWTLSGHNIALKDNIQKWDGSILNNNILNYDKGNIIGGNGNKGYSGNDDLAIKASIGYIQDIEIDKYGNIYIADVFFNAIRKIDTNGIITTVAGDGNSTRFRYCGDNGPATEACLNYPAGIALDDNGNLYIADTYNSKIRKVDTNGIITTIASISNPYDIELDSNDNIYISSSNHKILKIDDNNIISTIAGTGSRGYSGDNELATNALINKPYQIALDSKDNLYFTSNNQVVRKVDKNGIITTIAGKYNQVRNSGDGGYAINATLRFPRGLEVDLEGNIYISGDPNDYTINSIRKIDTNGIITSINDTEKIGRADAILIDNDKNLIIPDFYKYKIYKYINNPLYDKLNLFNNSESTKFFRNQDNTIDVYTLKGIHLKTIDSYTGKTIKEFKYDSEKRLIGIIDQFENELTIDRDSNGNPTLITAPNGQKTNLTVDSNGDLVNVAYEDNSEYSLEYIDDSLLSKVTHPNGFQSINIFDQNGRIIKEIDTNNEEWIFGKNIAESYVEYYLKKPEGDVTFYRDYKLDTGYEKSENITPNGDFVTITTSGDEKNVETITNGVSANNSYRIDVKTNQKILEKSTITQPSGLESVTTYNTEYVDNSEKVTLSKSQAITTNNKTIVVKNDYENAVNTITTPEGRIAKSEYDVNTRLTSKTTSGTLTPTTYTYDNLGRVISQITGTRIVSYTYNTRGNIATVTDPRNKTTSYEYDILDRTTKVIHPNGAIENYTYDASGNMTRLVTPVSTNHDFTYDGIGQRNSMKSPLNKLTSYSYNGNRKLTKIDRPSGKTVVNTYVDDKLATTVTSESSTTYDYIFNNKIGTITKGSEKVDYNYDGDLLTSLVYTGAINQTLSYTYNNDFLVTSFTYAGKTENYTYDNDNLVLISGDYTFTRDANNAYVTKVTDGKLIQDYTYDNYGELTKVSDNSFAYEITSKDNASLILQKTETINNATNTYDYTYDDNARLVEVKKNNTIVEIYLYDNNGNRLSATVNGITTTGSYTLDDQLEVYGNNTYRYDDDGYLSEKTTPDGINTYSYSTLGELQQVVTPDKTIRYLHNANNQRVAKLVDNVVVEKYLWANLTTLLAIYDKDDNLVQRFEYANSRMPISMIQGSNKYYLHYDQVGSLRAVSDISHNVIKEITYDTYGNILSDSNESFKVPFGFAGGLYDKDTKLNRFGYRDYDSYTGKWTAKDPIDFDGGDSNLYGYVLNDPVNFVDLDGLRLGQVTSGISKIKKVWKDLKFEGSKLDFRGVGSVCQIRYKKKPIFRIDYTAYPGTKGEFKLHYHIGNMKIHRPFPNWVNNTFKKFNK